MANENSDDMTMNDELHLAQSWGMEHWILPQSTSARGTLSKPSGIPHKLNERIFPNANRAPIALRNTSIKYEDPRQHKFILTALHCDELSSFTKPMH